jgi:beta-phosphoglucomutase-like phosphatase (HAD superfamily)
MKFKAVIFDLDGTQSTLDIADSMNTVNENALTLPTTLSRR